MLYIPGPPWISRRWGLYMLHERLCVILQGSAQMLRFNWWMYWWLPFPVTRWRSFRFGDRYQVWLRWCRLVRVLSYADHHWRMHGSYSIGQSRRGPGMKFLQDDIQNTSKLSLRTKFECNILIHSSPNGTCNCCKIWLSKLVPWCGIVSASNSGSSRSRSETSVSDLTPAIIVLPLYVLALRWGWYNTSERPTSYHRNLCIHFHSMSSSLQQVVQVTESVLWCLEVQVRTSTRAPSTWKCSYILNIILKNLLAFSDFHDDL